MTNDLALAAAAIAGAAVLAAAFLEFRVIKKKRELLDRQYALSYFHSLMSARAADIDEAFLLTILDVKRVERVKSRLKPEWTGQNVSREFLLTLVVQAEAIVAADQRELMLLEGLGCFALAMGGIVLSVAFALQAL